MRPLELTARLAAVASLVPEGCRLADVGTDHAFLPVWLLQSGRVERAIASDLRPGPLSRARATAEQYGCSQLELRLCSGLTGIRPMEVDTVVIAGMGGETIAAILEQAPWVRSAAVTLILQPMSTQPELRRYLWKRGFGIRRELLCQEGDKLYTVLLVRFGEASPMTPAEEWAGRQERGADQPLRGLYLDRLLERTGRALRGLAQSRKGESRARYEELLQVHRGLEEMKKELGS